MSTNQLLNLKKKTGGDPPIKHILKCWPEFFGEIKAGRKKHDLRRADDRTFEVGDILQLCEFDPVNGAYTGDAVFAKVTYLTSVDAPCAYSAEALDERFCILSIELL